MRAGTGHREDTDSGTIGFGWSDCRGRVGLPEHFVGSKALRLSRQEPLVPSLLRVVRPGASSSFLLLVAMPGAGAPSSFLTNQCNLLPTNLMKLDAQPQFPMSCSQFVASVSRLIGNQRPHCGNCGDIQNDFMGHKG